MKKLSLHLHPLVDQTFPKFNSTSCWAETFFFFFWCLFRVCCWSINFMIGAFSCLFLFHFVHYQNKISKRKRKSRFPNLSKKKNIFELEPLNFLVTFSKRPNFFSFKIKPKKKKKSLLFKMVHEHPLYKTFSKSWCLEAWAINLYQGVINFIWSM